MDNMKFLQVLDHPRERRDRQQIFSSRLHLKILLAKYPEYSYMNFCGGGSSAGGSSWLWPRWSWVQVPSRSPEIWIRPLRRIFFTSGVMMSHIYLIGPRASGKSTIGALLAYHLGYDFADLDQCLKDRHQKTVAQIVAECGWSGFRQMESEILRTVVARCADPTVFATGGGIVLDPANRQFMMDTGKVVWLRAPEDELVRRLSKNPDNSQRPSLTGAGLVQEVHQVLSEREPLYTACAHHVVNGIESPNNICDQISLALGLPLNEGI